MTEKRHDRSGAFALEAPMLELVRPEDMAALLEQAAVKRQELERQELAAASSRPAREPRAARARLGKTAARSAATVLRNPSGSKVPKSAPERKPAAQKKS
jgi:hypothetical protein